MATPQFIKLLSRNNNLQSLAALFGHQYIRFVSYSSFWEIKNQNIPNKLMDEGKSFITCFWHGRLLMMSLAWPYELPFYMLISSHPDGKLIAKITEKLGFRALKRDGKIGAGSAMRSMARILKQGHCVGITPDGPRGPRMRAGLGPIALAKLTGAPILPLSFSISRSKTLKSWDRFTLPLPFAKGVFIWGNPIEIATNSTSEELELARQNLEKELNQLTRSADKIFRKQAPKPAAGDSS